MVKKILVSVVAVLAITAMLSPLYALTFKSATTTHATLPTVTFAGVKGEIPYVTAYNVTSDKAAAVFEIWMHSGLSTTVKTPASASGQTGVKLTSTAGMTGGDYIVYQTAAGVFEASKISSVTDGDDLVMTANLTNTWAVGTPVFHLSKKYTAKCGAATITGPSTGGFGIVGGPKGSPVVALVDSTSAGRVSVAVATR